MDPISATNPYSIAAARAYGVASRASVPSFAPEAGTPVAFAQRAAQVSDRVDLTGFASAAQGASLRVATVRRADDAASIASARVEPAAAAQARVDRLVAASVDVSARAEVGLAPGAALSAPMGAGLSVDGGALPFYRSPSMANVAATSISAGRVLDVEG
jgi:hypothetical protein